MSESLTIELFSRQQAWAAIKAQLFPFLTAVLQSGGRWVLTVTRRKRTKAQARMNNKLNKAEREHLAKVKELPCSICDTPGPSEAHHVEQGLQYTCIALCPDCHRGPVLGLHGQRRMWAIKKMTEHDALNTTIRRLMENR